MQLEEDAKGVAARTRSGATAPDRERPRGLAQAFAEEVLRLMRAERRGDIASLRRLDPDRPDTPAFFSIVVKLAPEAGEASLLRYARLLQILALKPEALAPGSFGEAMAKAGISEARVQRLLSARGPAFADQARLIARRLGNYGALPHRDLGELLLIADHESDRAETLRLRIAQDYWRALDHDKASASTET
jgi:CRISPR system Cascade subunit CasB